MNAKLLLKEPEIITVDGKKIRKRSHDDVERLWSIFKKNTAEQFKAYMGYGVEEIEKIGIEKFLEAQDWYYDTDINSYKRDIDKVVICPVCKNEFCLFPTEYGVCNNCQKDYDMNRFESSLSSISPGSIMDVLTLFAFDEDVRNSLKKNSNSDIQKKEPEKSV